VEVAKKLVGATIGVATLAADAARHGLWLLAYHVDRQVRDTEDDER
jgi:hypothetical protein